VFLLNDCLFSLFISLWLSPETCGCTLVYINLLQNLCWDARINVAVLVWDRFVPFEKTVAGVWVYWLQCAAAVTFSVTPPTIQCRMWVEIELFRNQCLFQHCWLWFRVVDFSGYVTNVYRNPKLDFITLNPTKGSPTKHWEWWPFAHSRGGKWVEKIGEIWVTRKNRKGLCPCATFSITPPNPYRLF
jgi:hypothetical protein